MSAVADVPLGFASASVPGVAKAYAFRNSNVSAATGGTTSGRYYGVELDNAGRMFVNVP